MRTSDRLALWDIDGTLADDTHRKDAYLSGDFKEYFSSARMLDDPLIPEARYELLRLLDSGWSLAFCTARRERNRTPTVEWLVRHDLLGPWPVFMRPDDSPQNPAQYKASTIRTFRDMGHTVRMYEDDPDVHAEICSLVGEEDIVLVPWARRP